MIAERHFEEMTPLEVKRALADAGLTQAAVAEHLGVSAATVNDVIHGRSRSRRVERFIEEKTRIAFPTARGRRLTGQWGRSTASHMLRVVKGYNEVSRQITTLAELLGVPTAGRNAPELLAEVISAYYARGK